MSFFLLSVLFLSGCLTPAPKEVVAVEKITIPMKRVKFAVKVCGLNGGVKEIQIRPRELIFCKNGAVFNQ